MDSHWTEWLPIFAWVIDHPEGIVAVDTGETARTSDPAYFPKWHPYHRGSVRMNVKPEEEIGPQLKSMGIGNKDVKLVVLTHLHTDHAGGLHHFPDSRILVSGREYKLAKGFAGKIRGYVPHRWPKWFDPAPIGFQHKSLGPFDQTCKVTDVGDVVIVPTPGHTPGHVSVVVKSDDVTYFLAGDTSYNERNLFDRIPDGVSPNAIITLNTIERILAFAGSQPLVYLPCHDPGSGQRLKEKRPSAELP